MICRILIEPFATREEALASEELAIRAEFPKFNVQHNGSRHPLQSLFDATGRPAAFLPQVCPRAFLGR
jgi:hypothetical protein